MSSALEEFRAQRAAVQDVHTQLGEVSNLLRALNDEAAKLAQDPALRALLQEEQAWLGRADALVRGVRSFREWEVHVLRRAAWRRWVAAVVFSLAAAVASGAGYMWAAKPYESELASLRRRVELLDFVERRMLTMTAAERRQFDALMKPEDFRRH
ncbi:MAG: hypothetical protein ACRD1V_14780 [Vicinamibacterales bacterium]